MDSTVNQLELSARMRLSSALEDFYYALAAVALMVDVRGATMLRDLIVELRGPEIVLRREAASAFKRPRGVALELRRLEGLATMPRARRFLLLHLRSLVRESFEATREAARHASLLEELCQEDWYNFARLLRNAWSHDHRFLVRRRDRSLLPVVWPGKNREITEEMIGGPVTLEFFDWWLGSQLHAQMTMFLNLHAVGGVADGR